MFDGVQHLDYLTTDIVSKLNNKFQDKNVLIELDNTKYIEIDALRKLNPNIHIRITGPYTDQRYDYYVHESRIKPNVEYYKDSVVYTKDELVQILGKIEELEKNISPYWSDLQKVMYIFERLSGLIMYSPEIAKVDSKDIFSLRGLISGNSICGGYSLIFKEFMDRLGIENYYEEGFYYTDENDLVGNGHVWNIVRINGRYYPLDLTFNSNDFMNGFINTTEEFASKEFYKSYSPLYSEGKFDYKKDLSSIDSTFVNEMYSEIVNDKPIMHNTLKFVRDDGSEFLLVQVNNKKKDNTDMYAYYFAEKIDNKLGLPLLLYSDVNVMKILNYDRYKDVVNEYKDIDITDSKDYIINSLFSLENIRNSISRKSLYIGNITDGISNKNKEYLKSFKTSDISINTRDDETVYIIEKDTSKLPGVNSYKYYDLDVINNNYVVNMKNIHSENDLFKFYNKKIVDILLNKKHVDDCSKYRSGYLGMVIKRGLSTSVDYNFNSQILLNNRNYVNHGEAKLVEEEGKKNKR